MLACNFINGSAITTYPGSVLYCHALQGVAIIFSIVQALAKLMSEKIFTP